MTSEASIESVDDERVPGYDSSILSLMAGMDEALVKVNKRRWWIWTVFLMCSSAGVFNAWHIMVSNFYAFVPPHWCQVPALREANWTDQQIRRVTSPGGINDSSCYVIGWNFTHLAALGYDEALKFVSTSSLPKEVTCEHFAYEQENPYSTTISEWDLVCDRRIGKSNIQGSVAMGKFIGGFLFGFIADKYGRKVSYILASFTYMVFGPLAAFSPSYWFFISMRFLIGVAGSGCYESGFTILAEVVNKERRHILGCMYNLSYPVGYMILPFLSLLFSEWRSLQLACSLPMFILLVNCWYLPESPRWLLTKGHNERAWKVIRRIDKSLVPFSVDNPIKPEISRTGSLFSRILGSSSKFFTLLSVFELVKRVLIAYFCWVTASLIYYVLALNAVNFKTNQYLYTFMSGLIEIPGYCMPLLFLTRLGRKPVCAILYLISGLSLLIITLLPREYSSTILTLAMVGRFTDVGVFGLITVFTSELFPTTVRNTAVGSSLAMSQLGSINAPYIVDNLSAIAWFVPSSLCGGVALMAASLVLLFPETRGRPLTDTIDQVRNEKKDRVSFRNCCRFS